MKLSEIVHEYRVRHGLTMSELSKMCGLSDNYISLVERGKANPSRMTLMKLATGMKITESELKRKMGDVNQIP